MHVLMLFHAQLSLSKNPKHTLVCKARNAAKNWAFLIDIGRTRKENRGAIN